MKELRRFLHYLRGYRGQIAVAVLLLTAVTLLTLPNPMLVKHLVDVVLPAKDVPGMRLVIGAMFVCLVLRAGLAYWTRYLLQKIGMRITCDLRKDIFAHLQTLSVKFYETRQTGKIASRIAEDTGALHNLVTGVLVNLITDILTIAGIIGMLMWINWRLGLLTVAVLPLFLLNYRLSHKKLRKLSRRHRRNWDRVVGFLHERVANARLVKSFSMEQREIAKFNRGIENDYRNYNQLTMHNSRLWVLADFIAHTGAVSVWAMGGWLILQETLTVGELIAFTSYIWSLYNPIVRLNDVNAVVQRAVTSLEKIHEVLDTPSFAQDSAKAIEMPTPRGRVDFRNVQFSYEAGQRVLQDINLAAEPGQMIALVGASGSGKSTLVNLLCRFYDVDAGVILIDGLDIRQASIKSVRRHIGFVMQENVLFSGTILDNLKYGRPDATMESIIEATRAANAHDFILHLPRGYYTTVGERGVRLSGGQRQRIAIARAILKNPRIMIFDEATSALDSESERLIQDAMERLMQDRTPFVIAHRLSTVHNADRIIVLDNGRIVEQGTHESLIQREGVYRKLYEIQYGEAALQTL